jgi:hypothetical protein
LQQLLLHCRHQVRDGCPHVGTKRRVLKQPRAHLFFERLADFVAKFAVTVEAREQQGPRRRVFHHEQRVLILLPGVVRGVALLRVARVADHRKAVHSVFAGGRRLGGSGSGGGGRSIDGRGQGLRELQRFDDRGAAQLELGVAVDVQERTAGRDPLPLEVQRLRRLPGARQRTATHHRFLPQRDAKQAI